MTARSRPLTYQALYERVCRLANALRAHGVKKGDRVVIYLPMSIEGVVAMQACARIGAPHSVVFGGFSAKSLHERLVNVGAVAVITADEQVRGGKTLPLKTIVDEALAMGGTAAVSTVVIYGARAGGSPDLGARRSGCTTWRHAIPIPAFLNGVGRGTPAVRALYVGIDRHAEGRPASTGGYLLWAAVTMKWTFDIKPDDVFWCTADIGLDYRPHLHLLRPDCRGRHPGDLRRIPTWPDAGRFWDMIQRHKVSIFYTAPTAIRSLIKTARSRSRRASTQLRSQHAPHSRHGRRAHQSQRGGRGMPRTSAAGVARCSTRSGRPRTEGT